MNWLPPIKSFLRIFFGPLLHGCTGMAINFLFLTSPPRETEMALSTAGPNSLNSREAAEVSINETKETDEWIEPQGRVQQMHIHRVM